MRKTIPARPPKERLEEARRLSKEITNKSVLAGITHKVLEEKTRKIAREVRSGNNNSSSY